MIKKIFTFIWRKRLFNDVNGKYYEVDEVKGWRRARIKGQGTQTFLIKIGKHWY